MKKYDTSSWPLSTRVVKAKNGGEIRLLDILDPHLSEHSPPSYKVSYKEVIFNLIRQVIQFGIKNNVDAILWAGDIFNLKASSRNPLHFIAEVIALMQEAEDAGILNLGIAGNHDIKFGQLETGMEGQPIELLIQSRAYNLLDREEVVIEAEGHSLRIAGSSFIHGRAEEARDKTKKGADRLITVGHFWFGPATGEFYGEPVFGPDYFENSETDIYVIGHHHEDQGVVEERGKTFVSHGSITRTGAHANDLTRRPSAGFITVLKDKVDIKVLRPKIPPVEDLMDLEKRAQLIEEKKDMEEFIDSLHSTEIKTLDPRDILSGLDTTAEVRQKALDYLQAAEEEK